MDWQALLAAHPVLAASDRDSFATELTRAYPVRSIESAEGDTPFLAIVNRVRLRSVALH